MSTANYLTIDVEDYFQVSAFENISPPRTWDSFECRVERNTDLILSLLESREVKATFFILGWIAERYPQLPKRIAGAGHEVASHGYGHQRLCNLDRAGFREDIRSSKQLLEDLIGSQVYGYRAPSYSISLETTWAFDELLEVGYHYDSSIFPIKHDFYGIPDWPRFSGYAVKEKDGSWRPAEEPVNGSSLKELPITTVKVFNKNLPIAGGGYFRLLPYSVTRWGLRKVNEQEKQPFVFYLHPWEFDPQQPRMAGAKIKSKLRHYLNLKQTEKRFRQLLNDFEFMPIVDGLLGKPS